MLSNLGENPYPSDYYSDIRTNIMSKALKAEQNCENAMAEREEQLNKTNILSDELNMEKVELARRLLKEVIFKSEIFSALLLSPRWSRVEKCHRMPFNLPLNLFDQITVNRMDHFEENLFLQRDVDLIEAIYNGRLLRLLGLIK
ncbi:unnamed protein product [Haemonchus placei]|uniref:Uncharacterized protein n=1 Tax=Haemonchus placei TaxID=6290 RepID=A0A0N4WQF5_HAEPC|nr:unnamed protein product [Haemonchus placei]